MWPPFVRPRTKRARSGEAVPTTLGASIPLAGDKLNTRLGVVPGPRVSNPSLETPPDYEATPSRAQLR